MTRWKSRSSSITSPGAALSTCRWRPWRAWRNCRTSSGRSEEHTSELQSLMRISYAVFCLNKKNNEPIINKLGFCRDYKKPVNKSSHLFVAHNQNPFKVQHTI